MNDELSTLFNRVWKDLRQASEQATDQWRFCSLATIDEEGLPRVRKVVLREASETATSLVLLTDVRSPKWRQLQNHSQAEALFWCSQRREQLRCLAEVFLHEDDQSYQGLIRDLPESSAQDFAAARAPGTRLNEFAEGQEQGAEWHVGVIELRVRSMDWLRLDREGHQRARFERNGSYWSFSWVQP